MKTLSLPSVISQNAYFDAFIEKLVLKFDPLQIFSFSNNNFSQLEQGCFKEESNSYFDNHCLLLVTESITRIDYEAQDFANTTYLQGKVVVLCHSRLSIQQAIAANSRFFITVYEKGKLLYNNSKALIIDPIPTFIPTNSASKALKHYNYRMSLAQGFYVGAADCLTNWEETSICVFMLHQAVEQLCIGLIRVHIAYRSEFHNLYRLLNLCSCFSNEPYKLFTESEEDRRLFDILVKSYSGARYKSDFMVSKEDANTLLDKASDFIELTTRLCDKKIEEMERIKYESSFSYELSK